MEMNLLMSDCDIGLLDAIPKSEITNLKSNTPQYKKHFSSKKSGVRVVLKFVCLYFFCSKVYKVVGLFFFNDAKLRAFL